MTKQGNKLVTGKQSSKKKIYKKRWFWVSIAVLLLIFLVGGTSSTNPSKLSVSEGKQLVISGINSGIASSAYDGSGEITNFDCLTLSKIATKNGGDFYSDDVCQPDSTGFIAEKNDTAEFNKIMLYLSEDSNNGTILNCNAPTATFVFDKDDTELKSYSFEDKPCFQGSKLPISNVDIQTVDELITYSENQIKQRKKD